jgi:hypothetical protein
MLDVQESRVIVLGGEYWEESSVDPNAHPKETPYEPPVRFQFSTNKSDLVVQWPLNRLSAVAQPSQT